MSSRWYPLYKAGNPQLRVFLPNFWMKLIKPEIRLPPYMFQFHVSLEMTDYDIKNYLTKIYNLPVVHVRTEILMGSLGVIDDGGLSKKDDIRLAHVTMKRDFTFTFPDAVASEERKREGESLRKDLEKFEKASPQKLTSGRPNWFV